MALPNYVKFQRGSLASYNRLSQKDENTLYFIYDANDETKGSLYLGNRLIGEVGGSGGVNNLSELSDILINSAQAGDFLVLNSEGKWINIPATDVAQSILSAGGSFVAIDENEFKFNSVNSKLELKGYAEANIGMMPVKTNAGLSWQAAPSADINTRVGNLETDVSQAKSDLQAVDNKIATAISNANHLRYEIIDNLSEATETNVIYLYSNNSSDSSNIYDEYMLINGHLEILGSLAIDLSDYVTTTQLETALNNKANATTVAGLETRVGSLETSVSSLNSTISTLTSNVNTLTTSVNNLETRVSDLENNDYVLTSTLNAVVGDLSAINGVYNELESDASISDNLIEIYERLTWQEIHE